MLATLLGWKMDDNDWPEHGTLSAAAAAAHLGRSINWKVPYIIVALPLLNFKK